jgi:hypothetical protein
MYTKWWNFAPRVGLAWDVAGDGRTSIRGSIGTFYDFPHTHYMVSLTAGAPWAPRVILNDVSFDEPYANYPGGDPFPIPFGKNAARNATWPLFTTVTALSYDTPNMQVAQWNLSIQRQVGADWMVSASYLGTGTSHMWSLHQLNPAVFLGLGPCTLRGVQYATCSTTANTDARRRMNLQYAQWGQHFGDVPRIAPEANASYNALLLSFQRQAGRGVTINGNYTWSHCISDHPQTGGTAFGTRGNVGWTNGDRSLDRGNCVGAASDRRHIFNLSGVARTPSFANPALRVVASNWRFSPILRVMSGEAMTVTTNQDRALNGMSGQRVNQLQEDAYGDGTPDKFLNPAAFALPAMGTFGNVGIGSVVGPRNWQFDLSLSRVFQFRESQRMEFRAEAFNITNSFRMFNPETNFNSNTFGRVTSARDPRIMQFALKYFF